VSPHWYRCALAWLVGGCAACTSAPVRYYTLIQPEATKDFHIETTIAIDVRPVHIPAQINRPQLMIRGGKTQWVLLENERWASPLNDEIGEAVRLALQNRAAQMTESAALKSLVKLSVAIDVQRLEAELGRHAIIEGAWSARASQGSSDVIVTNCSFRAYEEIRDGYSEIVEAYQREVRALADAILAALTGSANEIHASCRLTSSAVR
jgi:uncharacterized lipoprotein YmbA